MSAARQKILERARRLRALSGSPNQHEAALAREMYAAHLGEHRISEAELAEAERKARGPQIRCAGDKGASWHADLALAIAGRHGCRPLCARGKIFFDGEGAVDAVGEFRAVLAETSVRCRLKHGDYWEIGDYSGRGGRRHFEHFAARDIEAVFRDVLSEIDAGGMTVTPAPRAWFPDEIALKPGFVAVTSGNPGNYATMFVGPSPGRKLAPRGDLSSFSDGKRLYTWVFEDDVAPAPRRLYCFATADRSLAVLAAGASIVGRNWHVVDVGRHVYGEPHNVDFGDAGRAP